MNTRIQVEHPITEQITGVDLVAEQIRAANHQPLSFSQEDVQLTGHAIECRINAESPYSGFLPSPGRIAEWVPPRDPGIRVDSHCYAGYLVPPYYDSLLAKVITSGADRSQAIERMRSALDRFIISGVETTMLFQQMLLKHPEYMNGKVNTRWVEDCILPEIRRAT
jgi:acetyl-CoA carboxylase biotin carboxylase subunit